MNTDQAESIINTGNFLAQLELNKQKMKLEPFNLEIALAHPERVVTKGGEKVTELHMFKTVNHPYLLVCIINGCIHTYDKNGISNMMSNLFLLPEIKEAWVNVYEENGVLCVGQSYKTEGEAKLLSSSRRYIKTIRITNEKD